MIVAALAAWNGFVATCSWVSKNRVLVLIILCVLLVVLLVREHRTLVQLRAAANAAGEREDIREGGGAVETPADRRALENQIASAKSESAGFRAAWEQVSAELANLKAHPVEVVRWQTQPAPATGTSRDQQPPAATTCTGPAQSSGTPSADAGAPPPACLLRLGDLLTVEAVEARYLTQDGNILPVITASCTRTTPTVSALYTGMLNIPAFKGYTSATPPPAPVYQRDTLTLALSAAWDPFHLRPFPEASADLDLRVYAGFSAFAAGGLRYNDAHDDVKTEARVGARYTFSLF